MQFLPIIAHIMEQERVKNLITGTQWFVALFSGPVGYAKREWELLKRVLAKPSSSSDMGKRTAINI